MSASPTDFAQASPEAEMLAKKHGDGSNWFFWIAGLSLVNSAINMAGIDGSFLVGLGLTQIIDGIAMAIATETGARGVTIISVTALVLDVLVAGTFVLWGVFARRYHRWAYIIGMILYALDGLLFLWVEDFLSLGFHVFALVCLYNGFKACGQLKQLQIPVAAVGSTGESGVDSETLSPPPPPPLAELADPIACPHCQQTFVAAPREGHLCPLCGEKLSDE